MSKRRGPGPLVGLGLGVSVLALMLAGIGLQKQEAASTDALTPPVQPAQPSQKAGADPFRAYLDAQQLGGTKLPGPVQGATAEPGPPGATQLRGPATATPAADPFRAFLEAQANAQGDASASPFAGRK